MKLKTLEELKPEIYEKGYNLSYNFLDCETFIFEEIREEAKLWRDELLNEFKYLCITCNKLVEDVNEHENHVVCRHPETAVEFINHFFNLEGEE